MLDNSLHRMSSRCTAGCHAKGRNEPITGRKRQVRRKTERRTGRAEKTAVICRIERRSCFCPHLYPSVKNRRQDYVCFCNMASAVAPSIFHNARRHSFSVDRFMRHRSASLAKSRPTLQLGGAKPERFFQEKLPQGIFCRKTRRA